MICFNLKKPVKIIIDTPSGYEPDYETIGKLIDNIILMAHEDKKDLECVGKDYSCDFVIGKKNKYIAHFLIKKTEYQLKIGFLKELTKYEATRAFSVPPKEKMMIKEAEKEARKQLEEKKKKDKEKEDKKKASKSKSVKESKVKKNDYSDLD